MYICGYLYPFRFSGNNFLRYTFSLGDVYIYFICCNFSAVMLYLDV